MIFGNDGKMSDERWAVPTLRRPRSIVKRAMSIVEMTILQLGAET